MSPDLAVLPSGLGEVRSPVPSATYVDEIADDLLARATFFVPIYMGPVANLALMSRMPRLRTCQLLTAGYDNALAHLPAGVALCNAAGVHDASTAELAVGLMIARLRGLDDAARDMAQGTWRHRPMPALADRTVVVVGAGGVGQAIRARLVPFEVRVVMVGRSARPGVHARAELDSLVTQADVVVLALPLDPSTAGMVDAAFLARLRDGALLVNVSRGPVVRTEDLLAELRSGRLQACLDVTDPEPLPADHPLWSAPGLLITPHAGGNSSAFLPRARRLVASQLERLSQGLPLANQVGVGRSA